MLTTSMQIITDGKDAATGAGPVGGLSTYPQVRPAHLLPMLPLLTHPCAPLCARPRRVPRAPIARTYACVQCAQERPHLRWARTVQNVCGELICYGWNDKFTLLRPPPSNTSDGRTHPAALVRVPEEGTSTRFRLYAGPPESHAQSTHAVSQYRASTLRAIGRR
ncbi:hypothetical protein B0H13DRAFT_2143198 [Mycena leptocephala]|nr:hypothetical protein B0H13DRAFT_2143198 [Mycena leptocephala]